ncbi:MAG: hypothetical protein A3I01_05150 [Betaproteobacteria bacterium RIFCSPLOWO2_02_FULL_65_24]|nr:MAG: hypothetical protein A3I01_05150 [Betaproteobacteria bacterium RIFCSPLOWO2_02_FULL_65_24]
MHPCSSVFQAMRRKGGGILPSAFRGAARDPEAQPAEPAMIVLDTSGTVCSCTAAAAGLFGAGLHGPVGRHITVLVPDLPLRPSTPGYNIAYARFKPDAGPWRELSGRDSQGRVFRLLGSLDTMEWEGAHHIVMSLRLRERAQPGAQGCDAADLNEFEGDAFAV